MSEALEILKSCDAFLEGHFLLSSGRHSGAYCQMAYLQQYPDRCAEVMKALADKVKEMPVVTTSSAMMHFSPGWMAKRFRHITLSTRSVKMARSSDLGTCHGDHCKRDGSMDGQKRRETAG